MTTPQRGGHNLIPTVLPYGGWLLALVLLIWIAKQFFGSFFQELGRRLAAPFIGLFGSRVLGKRALKKYRRAILKNYGEHALGFRREGSVNVKQVYVPLQYDHHGYRRDVTEAITSANRAVIMGEPGAGKSLLMKHILVTWADGSSRWNGKVPVLVELHRCNVTEVSLAGLIRDEFERNGVRCRESVVERALADGTLFILFDGLDEVTRNNQTRVVTSIKDFVAKCNNCKYVATCRIAVYTGQLSPQFSSTIAIAELDDAGIRQLLAKWPTLDAAEADRFFVGLAESPQLMRLAGSPLLLTMMIYLHTEVFSKTGRTLPGSRPAFYEVAVDHLLRRDRELARDYALSIYEGADKRAVLQRIALTLQQTPHDQPDRRSIERIQLIDTVKQVATNLNLREQDVVPLLTEIVDRSQLMIELDEHSSRYIFRHLTLQEFLAASELRNNPVLLMKNYRVDHDGWQETIRLWCGVTSLDCTDVVREIFSGNANDKILALQCVAEATNVDPTFAEDVVAYFIGLISSTASSRAIESALGTVAADDRPRGQLLLARLRELFLSDQPGHASAARVIAATRRPAAARILGERIIADDAARSALRTMGEQAIPALQATAASGDLQSVDDLGEIATASAASALIALIEGQSDAAFRAAWWIAALISRPEVEDGLRISHPTVPADAPLLDWVWWPFADKNNDHTLTGPMGRVAWLLAHDVADHSPDSARAIDRRLGFSVVLFGETAELDPAPSIVQSFSREQKRRFQDLREGLVRRIDRQLGLRGNPDSLPAASASSERQKHPIPASAIAMLLDKSGLPEHRQRVFCRLPIGIQYHMINDDLINPALRNQPVTMRQWVEAATPVKEPKVPTIIVAMSLTIVVLATLTAGGYHAFGPWFGARVGGPGWLNLSARFGLGCVASAVIIFLLSEFSSTVLGDLADDVLDIVDTEIGTIVAIVLLAVSMLSCLSIAVLILHRQIGWTATAVTIASIGAVILGLLLVIVRRNTQIRNPFRKYIELSPEELLQDLAVAAFSRRAISTHHVPSTSPKHR
jgi:hypothetical protein